MARDGERGRGDWKARSGSQNSGPYAEASGDTGPVDIAAVRRDDELIEAIAGDGAVQTSSTDEYQLASLLANWRAEIVNEPMPAGPDLDAIVAAVNKEVGVREARIGASGSRRLRLVRPIAGAAAAVALIMGGLTAFSYGAEPGDALWPFKEVVFSEQAQTTVVNRAGNDMAQAQQLIDEGKPEAAKVLLERANGNVGQVDDTGKQNDLRQQWERLVVQLQQRAPEIAESLLPSTTKAAEPGGSEPTTKPGGGVTTAPDTSVTTEPSVDPRILSTQPDTDGTTEPSDSATTPDEPTTDPSVPSTDPTEPTDPTTDPNVPPTTVPTAQPTTTVVVPTGLPQQPTLPPTGGGISDLPSVPGTEVVPTGGGFVPPTQLPTPPGGTR
ncbi:anti-sigma-D factor RsdA [Nocardia sp. CC227C]|uniref:anti-sigma-D factor RsdA n=1 Tax=Nocardia sp. CC227C TaxID=3044562 RepID=UPI00278C0735|nr:anti-sigma-D factor RsdA [Nocardia sp. CC227C]